MQTKNVRGLTAHIKTAALLSCMWAWPGLAWGQPNDTIAADEQPAVEATLQKYLQGSSFNDPDLIRAAFHDDADMFLDHPDHPIFLMTPERYAAGFAKREKDVFNGRYGRIIDIDVQGDIATAKAEILIPKIDARFIDLFLLKKLDGEWKIISKAADRAASARTGQSVALLAGLGPDADDISAFIDARAQAEQSGLTLILATPAGQPVLFDGLDMRNPAHRAALYDSEFLFLLEHPVAFSALNPDDVEAVTLLDPAQKDAAVGHADLSTLRALLCTDIDSC